VKQRFLASWRVGETRGRREGKKEGRKEGRKEGKTKADYWNMRI
jgi:predicted transposase YdaD